jgi:hypothetical protein
MYFFVIMYTRAVLELRRNELLGPLHLGLHQRKKQIEIYHMDCSALSGYAPLDRGLIYDLGLLL